MSTEPVGIDSLGPADLDPVRRLHVMAAAIPGARVTEQIIDASFPAVWSLMSDFEHGFGTFQPDMKSVSVIHREGDRLVVTARSHLGLRAHFDVVLRPGWCWMQSRFLLIGMAATPTPDGTNVALTGGIRIPGKAAILPLLTKREAIRSLRLLTQGLHDHR